MPLRKWVEELMIYSSDSLSRDEAEATKASSLGSWTLDIERADSPADVSAALQKYVNLKRITFCTHGFPGGVAFDNGSLTTWTLANITVPQNLYKDQGQLLFMGCETARTQYGESFLVAAGRRFFAGKGGIVGGATVPLIGYSSGTVLPYVTLHWNALPERGKLILFRLDAKGNVVAKTG